MKVLRGLKKQQKVIQPQDPEKIAEEKLAIFSEEPFLYTTDHNDDSESWTLSSFNMLQKPNQQASIESHGQSKTLKFNQKAGSSFHNRRQFSILEGMLNESSLKRYLKLSDDGQRKKCESVMFPERKSLSLTNYILFDKRKPSISQQKSNSSKCDFHRLKLLQLKKNIILRRKKRNLSSDERINISQTQSRNPSPNVKTKIPSFKSRNQTQKSKEEVQERALVIHKTKRDNRSFSEAENVLESIIKRKQVPNMNVKKYQKQYELMKEKLQKSKQIQTTLNHSKVQLHEYYKKFVY